MQMEGEDNNQDKENIANIRGSQQDCQKIISSIDQFLKEDNMFIMMGVNNSVMEEVDKDCILKTMD